ncbi:hypothetical protein JHK82_031798 [Glycine max]|nr:hypothetical protein JHK85_032457 [Glycine max]KAG4995063.1 hypothetical protein JHK86_031890 [Glycine max]KAG5125061.1 hypothetical protein JHK82_031798 [Glycine max]KAG5146487.1 hypothetical protein JHK84_032030 [Glycine max]
MGVKLVLAECSAWMNSIPAQHQRSNLCVESTGEDDNDTGSNEEVNSEDDNELNEDDEVHWKSYGSALDSWEPIEGTN